ncbi:hypothetical protein BDN72DRAFT_400757 [Pluteus cervinus]|uniref:Uncharacterized protein n=1 Tax=Pluteus cervinus TaxID=181527 RepID=A0ACD3B2R0_9AGAR|nr:hypothetical protein BDN72DRAFT_400757 [Pluteus cervinus]
MAASSPDILPFLSFPTELRLKIYGYYLRQSIIRIPGPTIPNTLSLLSTCRIVSEEASPQVLSTVTFSIWSTKDLIHFFGSLTKEQLGSLRHVAVWGSTFGLCTHYPDDMTAQGLPFIHVFNYFPGLRLDTITIRDGYHGPLVEELGWGDLAAFRELEQLILHGHGWRELRYLSPNKAFLNKNASNQPKDWDDVAKKRDGEESGASVRILVGKRLVPYTPVGGHQPVGSFWGRPTPWTPPSWECVDEEIPWREEDFHEFTHDRVIPPSTDSANNEQRPVVVIVRRGDGTDIAAGTDAVGSSVRTLLERVEWKEMKEKGVLRGWTWTRNT